MGQKCKVRMGLTGKETTVTYKEILLSVPFGYGNGRMFMSRQSRRLHRVLHRNS